MAMGTEEVNRDNDDLNMLLLGDSRAERATEKKRLKGDLNNVRHSPQPLSVKHLSPSMANKISQANAIHSRPKTGSNPNQTPPANPSQVSNRLWYSTCLAILLAHILIILKSAGWAL